MNKPPIMLATPKATSSLLAETVTLVIPSGSSTSLPSSFVVFLVFPVLAPKDFAATLDSKNPRRATRKAVEKASLTCLKLSESNGKCAWKGTPFALMFPRMSRPCLSHPHFHVSTADKTTTKNLSGMYATQGVLGCSLFFTSRNTITITKAPNATAQVILLASEE